MTSTLVAAFVSAGVLTLALAASTRDDASRALAFATSALLLLAPPALAIWLAPLALLAYGLHRAAFVRSRDGQERALAYVASPTSPESDLPASLDDADAREALSRWRVRAARVREVELARATEGRDRGRSSNVRSRFMAAMGHELRSPLNSIIGFAQVLEDGADGPLTPGQIENVTLVRRAAEELLLLLTDILDSARLEAGRVRLDRIWTASVEILTLTTERTRPLLETAGRELEVEVEPGLPPLFVDRGRVAQSLENLVRHALRFGGSGPLRLRAGSIREEAPKVRFCVIEPARELTAEELRQTFELGPELARTEGRSLALGLALGLARDLARLHGGDAGCENVEGGACWFVMLPVDPATPP